MRFTWNTFFRKFCSEPTQKMSATTCSKNISPQSSLTLFWTIIPQSLFSEIWALDRKKFKIWRKSWKIKFWSFLRKMTTKFWVILRFWANFSKFYKGWLSMNSCYIWSWIFLCFSNRARANPIAFSTFTYRKLGPLTKIWPHWLNLFSTF